MGSGVRRGSAPVIDSLRANDIAQLHVSSPRSVSPAPPVPRDQSELSPSVRVKDAFPSQSSLPLLPVFPVSSASEYRRFSDTNIRPSSEAPNENLTAPVRGGRRHSDLSSLLSLTSKQKHHLAKHGSHTCQACLSLLLQSREASHHYPSILMPTQSCPCELRPHLSSGSMTNPSQGRLKGSSDCSDFSLLQQSLFNIIGRKAALSHTTTTQATLLQSTAVQRPVCSDGDVRVKSHRQSGNLVWQQESLQNCEDSLCAREQQVSRAVGAVGHNNSEVSLVTPGGPTPA